MWVWCMLRLPRIVLIAAALYLPFVGTPAIAEKPANPVRWNGFYAGVYAGQAWAESDIRTNAGTATTTLPFTYFAATGHCAKQAGVLLR